MMLGQTNVKQTKQNKKKFHFLVSMWHYTKTALIHSQKSRQDTTFSSDLCAHNLIECFGLSENVQTFCQRSIHDDLSQI